LIVYIFFLAIFECIHNNSSILAVEYGKVLSRMQLHKNRTMLMSMAKYYLECSFTKIEQCYAYV